MLEAVVGAQTTPPDLRLGRAGLVEAAQVEITQPELMELLIQAAVEVVEETQETLISHQAQAVLEL
jgi:hypothetical protein